MQHQHYCLNHTIKNATLIGYYLTITISEMKLRHIHNNCVTRPPHGTQTRSSATEDTMFIWLVSSRESNTVLHWQKPPGSSWMDNRVHTKQSVRRSVIFFSHLKFIFRWDETNIAQAQLDKERKHTHEQMQDKQKVKQTAGLYSWPLPTLLVPTSTQNLPSSQMSCLSSLFPKMFSPLSFLLCAHFHFIHSHVLLLFSL